MAQRLMQPSIKDLALTMRDAIATARAEVLQDSAGLLADLDLGLQAISVLTREGGAFDLDAAPPANVIASTDLPRYGDGPFQTYLRDRTGLDTLRLEAVERISGGYSRDMILLRCLSEGRTRDIVVRREVPGGLLEGISLGVAGEYPLMEFAHAGGVPLATPLWLETDPAILGQPFVAMACAAGQCLGTSLGAAGEIDLPQLRALAAMLARLHRVDWRVRDSQQHIEHHSVSVTTGLLDNWDSYRRLTPMPPVPLLDEARHWLRDNLPEDGQPPCLNHGDIGFHNIMGDDTGFTALLDWEMAVVASPAKDIAHVRPSVEHLVDWETFVGWYVDAGGAKISEDELRWFEIFRAYSMTLVCHVALAKLTDPTVRRIDYFRLGFLALPVFSAQLSALLSATIQR
jgi:aminoglycoside phosphotransferase (APT) family kinase protein